MKILITGAAGFIGFHLCKNLILRKNFFIYGIDNLNNYYDISIKKDRLKILKQFSNFKFFKTDICDSRKLSLIFKKNRFDVVVNLAAQAGVRYSIENPKEYLDNNIIGFYNILENSKNFNIKHLIFASSGSVYGNSNSFPLEESENTNSPLSFYAATKKCNEIMAHSYSYIHNLKCTGIRFFTVYGPYGRPDMALFKFVKAILNNKKLQLFNKGNHVRDFTYIDDAVDGIVKIILINKNNNNRIFNIFNIGSDNPQTLKRFLKIIEKKTNLRAKIENKPMQLGDIYKTHASIQLIKRVKNFKVSTNIETGIENFLSWFKRYYSNGRK